MVYTRILMQYQQEFNVGKRDNTLLDRFKLLYLVSSLGGWII